MLDDMTQFPDDDDALIERLRWRAYDPALRTRDIRVPREWLVEHYGEELAGRCRHQGWDQHGPQYLNYPAGSPEAIAFHTDSPRGPAIPPATARELDEFERLIGYPLPHLLRRMYAEVGDGGFGPYVQGFASIGDGSLDRVRREHLAAGTPAAWLPLAACGCSLYWFTSLTEPGNPVLFYDYEWWDREEGRSPEEHVCHVVPSLREWLWVWAEFGSADVLLPLSASLVIE
jgi:hypothetical protein